MPKPRTGTSVRFSEEAEGLLAALTARLGLTKTAILEVAIRKFACEELPKGHVVREYRPARRGRPKLNRNVVVGEIPAWDEDKVTKDNGRV
jgi:hypothetical protein